MKVSVKGIDFGVEGSAVTSFLKNHMLLIIAITLLQEGQDM